MVKKKIEITFLKFMIFTSFMLIIGVLIPFIVSNYNNNYGLISSISDDISDNNDISFVIEECGKYDKIDQKLLCTRNKIDKFYKYNITEDNIILSYDQLLKKGGDCKNWAEFWKDVSKEYELENEYVIISINKYGRHMFNVISDESGYCVIDIMDIECHFYK